MKADYLTYRRATSVSLLGLVIQAALAVALLVYGVLARDHAALTACLFVALGIPIWLTLAIVFDQHRRERVEALEAERLAEAEGAGSSVFEGQGTEFRVAARRVQTLHRFVVPAVSLVVGAAMIALGLWRLTEGRAFLSPDRFAEPRQRGWAIAIGLTLAFVGFVFARYVSGMAKQRVWANLRAGSAAAVGAALLGLAMAVGQFIDIAGPNVVLRYLQVAFPIFMIAAGAEIFLNFVLDLYRPRKPGELPRPAFDSRFLGFAAAPDRIAKSISDAINYQLGFNVTSGWFYRLLSRSVLLLVLLGVGIIWALTSLTVVQPHQRAIVLRFGRPVGKELGPGLHLKAPWPIDTVEAPVLLRTDPRTGRSSVAGYTATGVRTLELGTPPPTAAGPILWTNEHAREETFQLVQPSRAGTRSAGQDQVAGLAMVAIEIPMQYAVRDVMLFDQLAAPELRDDLLRSVAQREIVRFFSGAALDDVIGGRRVEIAQQLRRRIEAAYAAMNPGPDGRPRGAGVEILSLGVMRAHPPQKVAANFERVVQAEQNRQAKIESANADEIETLTRVVGSVELANRIVAEIDALTALRDGRDRRATPEEILAQELKIQQLIETAGGRAAATIAEARAERWARHMRERGRAARYEGQLAAYEASPEVYKASLYFEALKQAFANARLYITSEAVKDLRITTDLQDRETGVDVFNPDIGKEPETP